MKIIIKHELKGLKVGDYSILGYEEEFALERKTLNDFINCITFDRERFSKELEKARKLKYFAIIIETSYYDIKNHNYRSKTNPKSVLNTIFAWSVKYNYPIFFVESREGGALAVIKLSEFYYKN